MLSVSTRPGANASLRRSRPSGLPFSNLEGQRVDFCLHGLSSAAGRTSSISFVTFANTLPGRPSGASGRRQASPAARPLGRLLSASGRPTVGLMVAGAFPSFHEGNSAAQHRSSDAIPAQVLFSAKPIKSVGMARERAPRSPPVARPPSHFPVTGSCNGRLATTAARCNVAAVALRPRDGLAPGLRSERPRVRVRPGSSRAGRTAGGNLRRSAARGCGRPTAAPAEQVHGAGDRGESTSRAADQRRRGRRSLPDRRPCPGRPSRRASGSR